MFGLDSRAGLTASLLWTALPKPVSIPLLAAAAVDFKEPLRFIVSFLD